MQPTFEYSGTTGLCPNSINSEPPSYTAVIRNQTPPPLYEDIMGSGDDLLSSFLSNDGQANNDEPPTYHDAVYDQLLH